MAPSDVACVQHAKSRLSRLRGLFYVVPPACLPPLWPCLLCSASKNRARSLSSTHITPTARPSLLSFCQSGLVDITTSTTTTTTTTTNKLNKQQPPPIEHHNQQQPMCLYLNLLFEVCWPFSRISSASTKTTKTTTTTTTTTTKQDNNINEKTKLNGHIKQQNRSQPPAELVWLSSKNNNNNNIESRQHYHASLTSENNYKLKPLDDLTGEEEETRKKGNEQIIIIEGHKEKMSTLAAQEEEQQQSSSTSSSGDRQVNRENSAHESLSKVHNTNGLSSETHMDNQKEVEKAKEEQRWKLIEAARFKIKTSSRRHLDFDDDYDLNDVHAANRSKWSGPFYFIQAADSQLGMIDSYVHKRTEPGWKEEIELCEQLVSICNQMQPRPLFMIICGDLVDSFPASDIGQKQVVDFKRIFAKLDQSIPLVCVCGNHDIGNEPTLQTVREYRETFGDDYYYFTRFDTLFIVINSQFYQHREFVRDYALEQDEWLEEMLSKCKLFKYSIVFEHIPWFLERPDEEDDYFNIRKEVRLQWLRKFKDAGVTKIMCGHYHRNAGGWFEDMELVVTSAIGAQCGKDRSGARIVRVLESSIEHKYYAMPDIPLKIEL